MLKEHNNKKYREIQTIEEAEQFRGKLVKYYEGPGYTTEKIYKISVFGDGKIKLNKMQVRFLLEQATIDGIPVGIEVVGQEFELPNVNKYTIQDLYFHDLFGMSELEARIRNYIFKKGWIAKTGWAYAYAIYFNGGSWNYCRMEYKSMFTPIDTQDHAAFICNNLNKLGVKP